MDKAAGPALPASSQLIEIVTRSLRHEIGDLLQTIYSTVAIVQARLGEGQALERRLLADLKARAEVCKYEIDAVVDLVCPIQLTLVPVDLTNLITGLLPSIARRFAHFRIVFEPTGPAFVLADSWRLLQLFPLLLTSACSAAQHQVEVKVVLLPGMGPGLGEVECWVRDDGLGASEEQLSWFSQPFTTTHHAVAGLGLALARRLADLHGGRAAVENLAEGGCRVRLLLPACSAPPRPAP